MQLKFCIFYTWSDVFNRWSAWDFQSNSKNANIANKDTFYIRKDNLGSLINNTGVFSFLFKKSN